MASKQNSSAPPKYAGLEYYEKKLDKVMSRFGVGEGDYNWNCDRHGGWVEFRYKGELYRFEHTVKAAQAAGISISYGSDAFAQIVMALEDLARIVERGIYDLSNWVAGMKALPEKATLPYFCAKLGLDHIPVSADEVHHQYKRMAHLYHPDKGGSDAEFSALIAARDEALQFLENNS